MKHINEFNTFTGQEVANHIEYITPESSDIPDYFIDKYILPNNGWKNKSIKLKDLLKDKDFKEYYKSGEERYDEYEVSGDDLYQELVVYKGQLLDGYSRAARMLRSGEKTAAAFVLEKQNLVKDMKYIKPIKEASEQQDQMAFSQLERIIDYATQLRDRMSAGKGLDPWMYGKIVKAEDYLNTLFDVVDGDDGVIESKVNRKKLSHDLWDRKGYDYKYLDKLSDKKLKALWDTEFYYESVEEKVEYSSTHINGEKVTSSWAGTSDNLREFIKMIEDAPETLDYIDVTSSTGHFSPSREKFKAPITNSKKKQIIKIVKAVEKEFKKKGDPITVFRFQSYYGASNRDKHLSDPAYITYRTRGIDKFSDDMSSGKYGSLD